MKFYAPQGKEEISKEAFVKLYSDSYYLGNPKQVSNASQSSRFVENEIDRLLKKGIRAPQDVAHVLAWKIGKINHSASGAEFVYASDWQNAEQLNVMRYGKTFDLPKIAHFIVDNIERLEAEAVHTPQNVLNELRNLNVSGIGPVYLITLLYFLSRGKYPIYDRFAKTAIRAIIEGKAPGEHIIYEDIGSKEFDTLMDHEMANYIADLTKVFGEEYQATRDIDRALWVYGHSFDSARRNSLC